MDGRYDCWESRGYGPAPTPETCRFCGAPSWIDPSDQRPPADYCHPSDHGTPPEDTEEKPE